MSGNFAIKGGGVGPLMANAIKNFHFDFLTTSLSILQKYSEYSAKTCPHIIHSGHISADVILIFSNSSFAVQCIYL